MKTLSQEPVIHLHDDILEPRLLADVQACLKDMSWKFGSMSYKAPGGYAYWYSHFAGTDFPENETSDCSDVLSHEAPVIGKMWKFLSGSVLDGHTLIRCYANGYPYGCEGLVHLDAKNPDDYTALFYPQAWEPNWAGETVFLTRQQPMDVITATMPRANRLVVFQGNVPHVARGISRMCPLLRITLMFKTKRL